MGDTGYDSQNLLRQLMDNIGDNIFFKDRQHNFIMINQANARWFGLKDAADAIGKSDFDFFDADYAQRELEGEEEIMETGEPLSGHVESTNYNGSLAWGSVTKIPMRDEHGEICGIMGIGRDITALKQQEMQLQEAHQEMAEDLRVAASLQKTFLPSRYPVLRGADGESRIQFQHYYEASSQLGGDFCSIQQLSESKVGLFICDVMGHGVRAALVTASIKAIAAELSRAELQAGDFLSKMNRRLHSLLQGGDRVIFATACYAIVDVETGELEIAVAGHPAPIHCCATTESTEFVPITVDVRGPALALLPDFCYTNLRLQIEAGDSLLMFTDGVLEATNEADHEFGDEELLNVVRDAAPCDVESLVAAVVDRLKAFNGKDSLADDICLLGFTLNKKSLGPDFLI